VHSFKKIKKVVKVDGLKPRKDGLDGGIKSRNLTSMNKNFFLCSGFPTNLLRAALCSMVRSPIFLHQLFRDLGYACSRR